MSNLLLAWELGGGLGHAGRLKPLARGLIDRGRQVTLCLRDLVQTASLLNDLPAARLQAPVWLHRTMGVPEPQASLAEILLTLGYLRPEMLAPLVQAWLDTIRLVRPDALVVDYAPTALIAARIHGVPAASVGMGFWMPPDVSPIPPFRDWEPLAPGRIARAEAQALQVVNTVLTRHGAAPLPRLSALFGGDLPLLCTWPETDHYPRTLAPGQRYLGPNFLPEGGQPPQWPAGDGPRVFAYLKAGHPDHAAVLQALVAHGCQVLCYLPEVTAGLAPPVVSGQIVYASGPVDLGQAFADRCALCVCHAGQATLVQALLKGVPLLLLPMQAEQFVLSRTVERTTGAAINAAARRRPTDYPALLRQLVDQPAARLAAEAFAQRHAGFSHAQQVREILDAVEGLLPDGASAPVARAVPGAPVVPPPAGPQP